MPVTLDVPGLDVKRYARYLARSWKKNRRIAFRHNDYLYVSDGYTALRSPHPLATNLITDGGLNEANEDLAKHLDDLFDGHANDRLVMSMTDVCMKISDESKARWLRADSVRLFLDGDRWAAFSEERLAFLDPDVLYGSCASGVATYLGIIPGVMHICKGPTRGNTVLIVCASLRYRNVIESDRDYKLVSTLNRIADAIAPEQVIKAEN